MNEQLFSVCLLCIDLDTDIRRFMMRAQEKGQNFEMDDSPSN